MMEKKTLGALGKNAGMVQVGFHVLKTEGVSALFRGALPALLKVAPASAVTFAVFDFVQKHL